MALTAASALLYWSARHGAIPVVGGKPTHTRNSSASITDQRGVLYSPIINTPRFGWDTIASERRQTMLLEMARTNSLLYSNDYSNAAWTKRTMTITTGVPDPTGGTGACTLTATATNSQCHQHLADGSSIVRIASAWMRRRTGSGVVTLYDPTAGTGYPMALTDQWQKFYSAQGGGASATRWFFLQLGTSGDAIDMYGAQLDDGPTGTSTIATTSAAVTRSADTFYWDYLAPPQAMMGYLRFIERGTAQTNNLYLLNIGNAAGGDPSFQVAVVGGFYRLFHGGAATAVTSTIGVVPAFGDTVEQAYLLQAGGNVQIIQSINGGAATSGALSGAAALGSAWADSRCYLNNVGPTNQGANAFAELKLVKYADVVASTPANIMAELRGYELGPNGDLLSSGS